MVPTYTRWFPKRPYVAEQKSNIELYSEASEFKFLTIYEDIKTHLEQNTP